MIREELIKGRIKGGEYGVWEQRKKWIKEEKKGGVTQKENT